MRPAEFWDLTSRELALFARGRAVRAQTDMRRALANAWHIAALVRAEKMPALDELLAPPQSRDPESLAREKREHESDHEELLKARRVPRPISEFKRNG